MNQEISRYIVLCKSSNFFGSAGSGQLWVTKLYQKGANGTCYEIPLHEINLTFVHLISKAYFLANFGVYCEKLTIRKIGMDK